MSNVVDPNAHPNDPPPVIGTVADNIQRVSAKDGSNVTKLSEPLTEGNWAVWKNRMKRALRLCEVDGYAYGTIPRPDDVTQARNWDYNDNYAQFVLLNNVSSTEMVYVGQCETAFAIWQSLEAIYEATGHQTIIAVIRNLFHTVADESVNISDHLNVLKTNWERINQVCDDDFKISDLLFKIIISSSLPMVWDAFTEPYVGGRKGVADRDPKKMMTSQQFIGILKDEYQRRVSRAQQADGPVINQAMLASRRSLVDRIAGPI